MAFFPPVVSRNVSRLFQRAIAPVAPLSGDLWFDTAAGNLKTFFGGAWRAMALARDDGSGRVIDVRAYGARTDARFLTAVSVVAGSRAVTCDAGVLTGVEVGWTFEIVGGGAPDSMAAPGPGRQNWQGTVASVDPGANTFTAAADPPAANPTAGGLRASVSVPIDAVMTAVWAAAAATGTRRVRVPAGKYVTRVGIFPPSAITLEGDGQERTILRALRLAPGVKFADVSDGTLQDLTIEGAGPDGGADGLTNSTGCVDVLRSQRIKVRRVTARYSSIGFNARNAVTQACADVLFSDCLAEDITTSNGVYGAGTTNGIGFWIFNAVQRSHLERCFARRIDRHGIYHDPGTSALTAAGDHGFIDHASGNALRTEDTGRSGIGVAIGLQGVRWGNFTNLSMVQHGKNPIAGTYSEDIAISLGGDQNGEYAAKTVVTGYLIKDCGGLPIDMQGVGNTLRGGRVDGFNLAQVNAIPVVQFASYGGYTAGNVLAGPDVTDNVVDGLDITYTGLSAKFVNAAVFAGGFSVPNGSGGTRTSKTLRNRVLNARFVDDVSKPSGAMASWSGGTTNGPSDGSDANWVGELHVYEQGGTYVRQIAVQAQAFARYKQRADGQMEWGAGTAATDTTLSRVATGVLGLSAGQLQARLRPASYAAAGAITIQPGLAFLSQASAGAYTLALPANPGDDGTVMWFISRTAFAHTITLPSSGFDAVGGGAKDVATFGGAIGDGFQIAAYLGIWYVISTKNVTFS